MYSIVCLHAAINSHDHCKCNEIAKLWLVCTKPRLTRTMMIKYGVQFVLVSPAFELQVALHDSDKVYGCTLIARFHWRSTVGARRTSLPSF